MKHVIKLGSNNHTIITLHGTGGNASDLFDIADYIDQKANKIGFQGDVNENGLSRYFARYPQGGFDLESLASATTDLLKSIEEVKDKYDLSNSLITIMGYSNGANLIKNLLKEISNIPVNNVILFHPSPITPLKDFKAQDNIKLLMTSGLNDPYINTIELKDLENKMITAKIDVSLYTHNHGHQITQDEINFAKDFIIKESEGSINE